MYRVLNVYITILNCRFPDRESRYVTLFIQRSPCFIYKKKVLEVSTGRRLYAIRPKNIYSYEIDLKYGRITCNILVELFNRMVSRVTFVSIVPVREYGAKYSVSKRIVQ